MLPEDKMIAQEFYSTRDFLSEFPTDEKFLWDQRASEGMSFW
jgi:hypothetical protein